MQEESIDASGSSEPRKEDVSGPRPPTPLPKASGVSPDLEDTRPMQPPAPPEREPGKMEVVALALGLVLLAFWLLMVLRGWPSLAPAEKNKKTEGQPGRWVTAEGPGGTFRITRGGASALVWDSAGRRVAVGSAEGLIEVWDVREGRRKQALETEGEVIALSFRAGGPGVDAASDPPRLYSLQGTARGHGFESCQLAEWEMDAGLMRSRRNVGVTSVKAAAFDVKSNRLVLASENEIELWELERMGSLEIPVESLCPASVALCGADTAFVLAGEPRGEVVLVNSDSRKAERKAFYGLPVRTVVAFEERGAAAGFSPELEGNALKPRPIKFCPNWSQPEASVRDLTGVPGDVRSLQFVGKSRLVAFCVFLEGDAAPFRRVVTLAAWDTETGEKAGQIPLDADARLCQVSPDGAWLAEAGLGGKVTIRPLNFDGEKK